MRIPWESFLARYRALGRNLAAGLTGSRDDADDVVQEAMLALLRAERDGERFATLEHARNYFLRAVRNLALRRRLSAANHEPLRESLGELAFQSEPLPEFGGLASELEREKARLSALDAAVSGLEPDARALFESRLRERRTLAAISDETGVPISTLHSREKALLERLRRAVERAGDGP